MGMWGGICGIEVVVDVGKVVEVGKVVDVGEYTGEI